MIALIERNLIKERVSLIMYIVNITTLDINALKNNTLIMGLGVGILDQNAKTSFNSGKGIKNLK